MVLAAQGVPADLLIRPQLRSECRAQQRHHLPLLVNLPWLHQHRYVLLDLCHVWQNQCRPLCSVVWTSWLEN